MNILDDRYIRILLFLEKYDREYATATVCTSIPCEINDIYYLINEKYITWFSYDIPSIDAKGRNLLAGWRDSNSSKFATKRQNLIATWIGVIALAISLGALLVELLQ